MKNYKLPFSIFILRIIAIVTMTFDHVGVIFEMTSNPVLNQISDPFRIIGRLAMPLFAFLIAEGVRHTRSYKKYALRIGILASVVSLTLILLNVIPFTKEMGVADGLGNIFVDLLLGSLAIYLFEHKNKCIKPLGILPIGLSIISFVVRALETKNGIVINWYPYFIRGDYDWLTTVLIVAFYYANSLANLFIKNISKLSGISESNILDTSFHRFVSNLFVFIALLIISLIRWSMFFVIDRRYLTFTFIELQNYAIISGVFILLYNGKRGYNAKWFKIFSYLYYPVHIIILFIIFLFI